MSLLASLKGEIARRVPIERVPEPPLHRIRPTWRQASVPRIERALARAQQRDPGGWHVVAASTAVPAAESITVTVMGQDVVLWRDGAQLMAGPGSCPHMGALLRQCPVFDGNVHCRWHGLPLGKEGFGAWQPYPAYDDGVLAWVQLPTEGESISDLPTLTRRPPLEGSIAAVVEIPVRCQPSDVIANRLDPWHGAWFHPYAFSHLTVDEGASDDEVLVVDVTFRLNKTWGVPVRAEFACPDARTIVMTIVEGEGTGSVVETHATYVGLDADGEPMTRITEATVAYSPRPGFRAARAAGALIRPLMRRTARQLWVDDAEYAERRYEVRESS